LSFASSRQLLLRCSNSCIDAIEKKVSKEAARQTGIDALLGFFD